MDVPGTATQIRESLKSPSADEFAVGVSRQLGGRGAMRADVVYRNFNDFYSERVDTTTGQVTNEIGDEFDLKLVENTNDARPPVHGAEHAGHLPLRLAHDARRQLHAVASCGATSTVRTSAPAR